MPCPTSIPGPPSLLAAATAHVGDVVSLAIEYTPDRSAVVVADARCDLARLLAQAYHACLPQATHVSFDATTPEEVMRIFATLRPGDLVVLIQSTSFRLEAFRIRVELFKRGLKVIEHPHLARMQASEYGPYVEALAYDPTYYRGVGVALQHRIDRARRALLDSGNGAQLRYGCGFEPAKLNVGAYATLKNFGGQFPIGEVFTEPADLEHVAGRVRIFAFGDTDFRVNTPDEPITLVIEGGRVVEAIDTTPAFEGVLAQIRAEEEVWVRELGFGMNRAFSRTRRVSDVGTYERMCGIHLSLGAKHAIYDKPRLKRKAGKYHVDAFAITERVWLDDDVVFEHGAWCP